MNYNKSDNPNKDGANLRRVRVGRRHAGEHGSRRWGLLVVDILLLVTILAAIFFLVVLLTPFDPFGGGETEERTVLYTVEISGVDRDSVQSLHVGDIVTDVDTGSVIGEVVEVASRAYEVYTDLPSTEADLTADGEHNIHVVTKKIYPEDFQTLAVTIRVTADYEKGVGYWAQDCRIAVGRTYEIRLPAYAGEGVVVTFAEE